MKENELKQLRQRRVEIVKPKSPTISSEEIARHTANYLEKGGKINTVPMGATSDIEVGIPYELSLDFRKGRKIGASKRRFNGQIK